jgi:hypothetical protein
VQERKLTVRKTVSEMDCGVARRLVTTVKPLQNPKAELPIVVTELPIVTFVKSEQYAKASRPIVVTELGIVTAVKPLQV